MNTVNEVKTPMYPSFTWLWMNTRARSKNTRVPITTHKKKLCFPSSAPMRESRIFYHHYHLAIYIISSATIGFDWLFSPLSFPIIFHLKANFPKGIDGDPLRLVPLSNSFCMLLGG